MKQLLTLLLLLPMLAHAQKNLVKCVSAGGEVRHTTAGCMRGEREVQIDNNVSLTQFAQRASQSVKKTRSGLDETDLTYYLTQTNSKKDWSDNVIRSFLEGNEAVVVVDTFRMVKLEEICQATMNWIEEYPHPRFALDAMRIEFSTGDTFESRFVKTPRQCDFELR
jgi:4-hydroxy-3-methylbut-2-enyl diphosphate reductase IspH